MSAFPPDPGAAPRPALLPSDTGPHSGLDEHWSPAEAPVDTAGTQLPSRIAWRRQALLLAAVVGCLTVFLLARVMANNPHLPAEWRHNANGRLELMSSPLAELQPLLGSELAGVVGPDGQVQALPSLALSHSARWIADDLTRAELITSRLQAAQALESGHLVLAFSDGRRVAIDARPRGYAALGSMFWLMSAFAMILFLVGWIVPLVQPQLRNLLYALMAHAQAGQLLLSAIASVPALALPSSLVTAEPLLRTVLDLATGAAIVQAATLHPRDMPWRRLITGGTWLLTGALLLLSLSGQLPNAWWWVQAVLLLEGAGCIALMSWSYQVEPHPFALVMRRFCLVTLATLALLTLAVAMMPTMPADVQPLTGVGPVIWGVFFASVVLLVPFIARSQNVMREFAMLAGISTVATSIDLLFVAVFSFSQFWSLTLSLFLALGAYAAVRQWLVQQMMGTRALTTERMFEHLYRIAREVEARPERAGERMAELLRHVFEPLETTFTDGRGQHSRIASNGAVLLVPMPKLVSGPELEGTVALRFAERGKRLFTPEDARLADRILEQLMRAVAHDRAVERGRSEERLRIAQDLHDDIGARLLTLMYKAPSQEMEDYIRHTLQDLKTLTRGLAAQSHPLSFAAAEWKTDISQRLAAVHCSLEWTTRFDQDVTLNMVEWSSLTRILRELISNALAHSQARQVQMDLTLEQGRFSIMMSDDGVGREPARWSHGLGLGGIRKRVKLMGGTVQWQEREPRGIVCQVHIPRLSGAV